MPRYRSILGSLFLFTLVFISCSENNTSKSNTSAPEQTIYSTDAALDIINGEWVYHGELFTGEIKELFPGGKIQSIRPVENGRQQGLALRFYEDGKPESSRWYTKGEKDRVHTGWWPNGNKKFEYHFSNGMYDGTFTEWYESGKMIQEVNYENGKDLSGKGWRENGKLYMSYILKDGRRYGLYNANLCFPIKKDSIIKTKDSIK